MKRLNLLVDDDLFIEFKSLPGTMSEHIKNAMREYLKSLYSVSASKSKGVGHYE